MIMLYEPGDRFQLNEESGNPGRKGFVLRHDPGDYEKVLVRFDGFAYNSVTTVSYLTYLPSEPFRPAVIAGDCIHPGIFATERPSEHCYACDRDIPRHEL